jgi:DNA excision repair protein ERCC-4
MEGNVDEIDSITENPLIFYGALSTIAIDFKIPIIPTSSAIHTAKLLVSLCSKKESIKGPFLKKIKKSNDLHKQQLSVLCSLPGIGEKSAMRILEKFGSPIIALNSTSKDLAKIPGLGEIRAKKIKKMLEKKSKHKKLSNQKTLHD